MESSSVGRATQDMECYNNSITVKAVRRGRDPLDPNKRIHSLDRWLFTASRTPLPNLGDSTPWIEQKTIILFFKPVYIGDLAGRDSSTCANNDLLRNCHILLLPKPPSTGESVTLVSANYNRYWPILSADWHCDPPKATTIWSKQLARTTSENQDLKIQTPNSAI